MATKGTVFNHRVQHTGLIQIKEAEPWGLKIVLDGQGDFFGEVFLNFGNASAIKAFATELLASVPKIEAAEKAYAERAEREYKANRVEELRKQLAELGAE